MNKINTQFGITNMLLDVSPSALGFKRNEYLMLLKLSRYMDKDGTCYPSQTTLANGLDITRGVCNTTIKSLSDLGAITIETRKLSCGGRASSLYKLNMGYFKAKLSDKSITAETVLSSVKSVSGLLSELQKGKLNFTDIELLQLIESGHLSLADEYMIKGEIARRNEDRIK